MFVRLRKQVEAGLYDQARDTMWILMNSSAYLDSAYNYVARNWHRKRPLFLVEKELKEVKTLIREKATRISYKRVYLDEVTKLRPLGVPTVPWRVYLHMYNNLITEWRRVSEAGKQHGYLPGLGVMSAWQSLLPLLSSPNLFEADFKGFFDNVTHVGISVVLADMGFPASELDFITSLNESVVTLPQQLQIEETRADLLGQVLPSGSSEGFSYPDGQYTFSEETMRLLESNPGSLHGPTSWFKDVSWMDIPPIRAVDGTAAVWDALIADDLERGGDRPVKEVGVPQGAPTSCSLATLALRPLERLIDCVLYADDGVYAPHTSDVDPVVVVSNPAFGVQANPKKIRWLKKDGKWLVPSFKFLGIVCHTPYRVSLTIPWWWPGRELLNSEWFGRVFSYRIGYRFSAQTRKGATLKFTDKESLLSYLSIARDGMLKDSSVGRYFRNRPLTEWLVYNTAHWSQLRGKARLLWGNRNTGWFVARMFINDWLVKVDQNFFLSYRKDSWMALVWPIYAMDHNLLWDKISVFTASSFATHDLLRIIHNLDVKKVKRPAYRFRKVRVRSIRSSDKFGRLMGWFRIFNFKRYRK
jgi:hypothetical protein